MWDTDLRFRLLAWHAWSPGLNNEETWRAWARGARVSVEETTAPALSFMPAMLRRRLSYSGRMAAEVIYRILGSNTQIPMVFASRHGEVERSIDLLTNLAEESLPSPTTFGLSVHNAAAGVISIARADTAPVSAVAATTIGAAFLEALAWLGDGHEKVALVLCDEPIPEVYAQYVTNHHPPYACALLLGVTEGAAYRLRKLPSDSGMTEASALEIPGVLLGETGSITLCSGGQCWALERNADEA